MSTAAAAITVTAAALAVAVPMAAAGGRRRAPALVGGALLLAGTAVAAVAGKPGGALLAALPLAGFAVLVAGGVRALGALRLPPAASVGLATLLGCGLLVLPFAGDSLVEARGPGRWSPGVVALLVDGSPLCASVGGGLGVDLLRTPRAYGSGGEGLSRIGPYYPYSYPGPAAAGAGFAAAGLLLGWGAGVARRRSGS